MKTKDKITEVIGGAVIATLLVAGIRAEIQNELTPVWSPTAPKDTATAIYKDGVALDSTEYTKPSKLNSQSIHTSIRTDVRTPCWTVNSKQSIILDSASHESQKQHPRYRTMLRYQREFISATKKTNEIPNQIWTTLDTINALNLPNPTLLAAIIQKESYGYQYAVNIGSKEKSVGITQINAKTANLTTFEKAHIFDLSINLKLGSQVLQQCLSRYPDTAMAVRAYNRGIGARNSKRLARQCSYARQVLGYEAVIRKHIH